MVRYTFNLVIELGEWNHIHSELEVGLYAKDVDAIISFMVENYKDIDYEKFYSLHPQLEERVNNAALAMIPHSLDGYYYSEDDMTGYWVEFPDELKELAEVELGHPLVTLTKYKMKSLQRRNWNSRNGSRSMVTSLWHRRKLTIRKERPTTSPYFQITILGLRRMMLLRQQKVVTAQM